MTSSPGGSDEHDLGLGLQLEMDMENTLVGSSEDAGRDPNSWSEYDWPHADQVLDVLDDMPYTQSPTQSQSHSLSSSSLESSPTLASLPHLQDNSSTTHSGSVHSKPSLTIDTSRSLSTSLMSNLRLGLGLPIDPEMDMLAMPPLSPSSPYHFGTRHAATHPHSSMMARTSSTSTTVSASRPITPPSHTSFPYPRSMESMSASNSKPFPTSFGHSFGMSDEHGDGGVVMAHRTLHHPMSAPNASTVAYPEALMMMMVKAEDEDVTADIEAEMFGYVVRSDTPSCAPSREQSRGPLPSSAAAGGEYRDAQAPEQYYYSPPPTGHGNHNGNGGDNTNSYYYHSDPIIASASAPSILISPSSSSLLSQLPPSLIPYYQSEQEQEKERARYAHTYNTPTSISSTSSPSEDGGICRNTGHGYPLTPVTPSFPPGSNLYPTTIGMMMTASYSAHGHGQGQMISPAPSPHPSTSSGSSSAPGPVTHAHTHAPNPSSSNIVDGNGSGAIGTSSYSSGSGNSGESSGPSNVHGAPHYQHQHHQQHPNHASVGSAPGFHVHGGGAGGPSGGEKLNLKRRRDDNDDDEIGEQDARDNKGEEGPSSGAAVDHQPQSLNENSTVTVPSSSIPASTERQARRSPAPQPILAAPPRRRRKTNSQGGSVPVPGTTPLTSTAGSSSSVMPATRRSTQASAGANVQSNAEDTAMTDEPLSPTTSTIGVGATSADSPTATTTGARRRGKLPKETTETLKTWLMAHKTHPYPTEDEKRMLCDRTGLNMNQVSNWMINARRRILTPASKQFNVAQVTYANATGTTASSSGASGSNSSSGTANARAALASVASSSNSTRRPAVPSLRGLPSSASLPPPPSSSPWAPPTRRAPVTLPGISTTTSTSNASINSPGSNMLSSPHQHYATPQQPSARRSPQTSTRSIYSRLPSSSSASGSPSGSVPISTPYPGGPSPNLHPRSHHSSDERQSLPSSYALRQTQPIMTASPSPMYSPPGPGNSGNDRGYATSPVVGTPSAEHFAAYGYSPAQAAYVAGLTAANQGQRSSVGTSVYAPFVSQTPNTTQVRSQSVGPRGMQQQGRYDSHHSQQSSSSHQQQQYYDHVESASPEVSSNGNSNNSNPRSSSDHSTPSAQAGSAENDTSGYSY